MLLSFDLQIFWQGNPEILLLQEGNGAAGIKMQVLSGLIPFLSLLLCDSGCLWQST